MLPATDLPLMPDALRRDQQQPKQAERSSATQAVVTVPAALIGGPGTVATAHWLKGRKPKDTPPKQEPPK